MDSPEGAERSSVKAQTGNCEGAYKQYVTEQLTGLQRRMMKAQPLREGR